MRSGTLALMLVFLNPVAAQNISAANRTLDWDYVVNRLPQLDRYFFDHLDRVQFQQAADALNAKLPTATDAEFYVGLAQLVAMAGDMHTMLYLSPGSSPPAGFGFFDLQFRWLDDGLFVVGAGAAYTSALGSQLVAVGGLPINDVVERVGTTFAHSNDQFLHTMAEQHLRYPHVLQGLHISPATPATDFTFQTLAGQQFTLQVGQGTNIARLDPPVSQGPWPDYLKYGNPYYGDLSNSFFYSAPTKVLFAKYNTCEDLPGAPVSAFNDGVLAALDSNPVDTLVIDFRGNSGGNEYLLFPLGAGIIHRMPQLRLNPNFHIYLVIDKGTFSSGMYDPMAFISGFMAGYEGVPPIDRSVITVIGEPTGGKPVGYGNTVQFALPGSGLGGQYATVSVDQDLGVIPDLPSFNPDVPIRTRSTDWFARFDPVMAAMLARSNGAPPSPTGDAIVVNGASFRTDQGVAPGSFASVFGAFAQVPDRLLVGGAEATIVSAGTAQVNFLVPATTAPGTTGISVRAGGVELASGDFTVSATGPGIFVLDSTDPSQPGAVENQDFSINGAGNAASAGSVVQIFATGYGALDASGAAPVQVFFGDLPGEVLYSGPAPKLPGLWQINARIPQGTPSGQNSLFLAAGNVASNGVTLWVR